MPNIWTHIQFCEDVIDLIPYTQQLFADHEAYLKLGAQGPDPFFYYNFWPWIKNGPVQTIGQKLHTEKCGDFLMELIDAGKHESTVVQAYIFGFVTHHILDRNTHPYIHYFAGYEGSNHQRLEVIIDTLLMKNHHNLKTWKTPVYKEINIGRSIDKQIVHLLYSTINRYYPEIRQEKAAYIQKSYRDMKLALKILADPYGWKNKLLGSIVSPYSHQPVRAERDYLNLRHATWHHSATNKPSTKSFIDLYKEAQVEGVEIMKQILHYWEESGTASRAHVIDLIGNISFDTGLSLAYDRKNKYSDPII
ncbi:zinc dependent phospholipase C family protein [Virgibacillus sp. W0181]|uniref:zinc dependent phospholipase C family protein n=1 Tax=Virgibacillus sp. W0181 TaxID=3391581 RepID=UPI003F471EAE